MPDNSITGMYASLNHTPGPWLSGGPVTRGSLLKTLTGGTGPNGISEEGVYEIGSKSERYPPALAVVNRRDEHAEDNAQLIAASPTLYEYAFEAAQGGDMKARAMLEGLGLSEEPKLINAADVGPPPDLSKVVYVAGGCININVDYEYNIALDQCDTPAKILSWMVHLADKTWMDLDIMQRFIVLAAEQCGVNPHERL
ncbi:MAG: hypothetical protein ABIG44_14280 [Planctomycetota bacterium]